ncbi:Transcription factor MYB44 [Dichanthelium oligosanthes]|uniref:Transcription factor MYB44 n=1 Tax=Dichanthelium oligosanthes TaxID=888268 RepID=A0A1E5W9P7_9POAL|nr:Transcription factor MYB44 [Dichanthelium oligosanthes]
MAVPDDAAAAGGVRGEGTKKAWTKEEDAVLREQVRAHGPQNWAAISAALPERNPKSCRLRWCQHLTPGVDAVRPFTPEEDDKILHLHRLFPNKWATIAGFLPGRSDNAIKNRWNSVLSKQRRRLAAAAAPLCRLPDGTLPLFPLAPDDLRAFGRGAPAPSRTQPVDKGVDLSGACMNLFPLAPGDLVRGTMRARRRGWMWTAAPTRRSPS